MKHLSFNKRQSIATTMMLHLLLDWVAHTDDGNDMSDDENFARDLVVKAIEETIELSTSWEQVASSKSRNRVIRKVSHAKAPKRRAS